MTAMLQITTEDNVRLNARFYQAENARAVVLINPGTATKTSFYLPFAEFLLGHGFHVVLWNYRGFAESKTVSLRHCDYRYSDIGRYDMPAVIDAVKTLQPNLPLYCVGHSAGGQQLGLAKNHHQLDGLIAVAVSAGYFAYMPLAYRLKANFFFRLKANFFFRLFAPVTAALFRYVPAKTFNFMEDLPVGFTREWGAWCWEKQLFFSDKFYGRSIPDTTYKNFDIPTFVVSADDDEICTEPNVANFWTHVTSNKPIRFKRYKAAESATKAIGHFGYFRQHNKPIWLDILKMINELENERTAVHG